MQYQLAQELFVRLGQPEDLDGAQLRLVVAAIERTRDHKHLAYVQRSRQRRVGIRKNEHFQ